MIFIGIGGVSRSGKSTLSLLLRDALVQQQGKRVQVLHQDDWVRPESEIPRIKGHTDWECPESMDFRQLERAMRAAATDCDVVIVEGILVFYDEAVNALFDRRYLVEADRETFLARRAQETRWGPEPPWYPEYVWEGYLRWGRELGGGGVVRVLKSGQPNWQQPVWEDWGVKNTGTIKKPALKPLM